MSWFSSFGVALISGVAGLLLAGFIANLCVSWYRVSSFEGKSGYFVVFIALAGGIVGGIVGLVTARVVAAGVEPGFPKALGFEFGVTVGSAAMVTLLCRLGADIAPTLDGKELELEVELRCPKGFSLPTPDEYGATAGVYLPGGGRLRAERLRVTEIKTLDGHLVVPATVPLSTSASQKFLQIRLNAEHNLLFNLPLRSNPRAEDCEWSKWVESGWDANKPEPGKEAKFNARYRVRIVEPPPPDPDPEVARAQEFSSIPTDAPLAEWLPYLFESPNAERTKVVVEHINAQQLELAALIRGSDDTLREYALRSVMYVEQPATELVEAVLGEGRAIADAIRRFYALPETDADSSGIPMNLSFRFNTWKHAWWTLHKQLGIDGRPPVQEIHNLALVRAKDAGIGEIEINARVILDALNKPPEDKNP